MKRIALTLLSFTLVACDYTTDSVPTYPDGTVFIATDFSETTTEWVAGFSDYPVGDEETFGLTAELSSSPGETQQSSFLLRGNNLSSDLFMYLKREVTDLAPNSEYQVHFITRVWSNAGENCVGAGGAPGESVSIKAGAAVIEPIQADYYMNIDIGNQSTSGANAVVLGDVSVSSLACDSELYSLNTFESDPYKDISITTDDDGTAWVFVGSDSGFMGVTTLYFDTIEAILVPMDSSGE